MPGLQVKASRRSHAGAEREAEYLIDPPDIASTEEGDDGSSGILKPYLRWLTNGDFAYGAEASDPIDDDNNPLPSWSFTRGSGAQPDALWAAAGWGGLSPKLRFRMAAGAAGDSAFISQRFRLGGVTNLLPLSWTVLVYAIPSGAPTAMELFATITSRDTNDLAVESLTEAIALNALTAGAVLTPLAVRYQNTSGYDSLVIDVGLRRAGAAAGATDTVDVGLVFLAETRPGEATLTDVFAPAQITATQNDYHPAGLDDAAFLQINSDAARTITGIYSGAVAPSGAGPAGRVVALYNSGAFTITLADESASSTTTNRFTCPGSTSFALGPDASVLLVHNGQRWIVFGSAPSFSKGTSFPAGPASDDIFYRTDLDLLCFYDGTRWLTVAEYTLDFNWFTASATGEQSYGAALDTIGAIYITNFAISFFVAGGASALSGTASWVFNLVSNIGAAKTTRSTITINSGASAVWRSASNANVNAALGTTVNMISVDAVKTGTPGNCSTAALMTYRRILT